MHHSHFFNHENKILTLLGLEVKSERLKKKKKKKSNKMKTHFLDKER